jgi:hypothetical protein
MGGKLVHSLVYNSIKDRNYLKGQLGMIWRFIKWRVLKIEKM